MIDVEDLSVGFGDVEAVSDATLTVDRGEIVGLVGPNGAGKTTLLGAINGLVDPTDGSVRIAGDDVAELSARAIARRVATVPQETSLSFSFPVREVVAMGRTAYRSRFERASATDREHTRRAMERTGIKRFADRAIDEVSGGERQRVVLARALCQDPEALLLDEPTASLDINHQVRTLSLVREFVADGRAALCAIHDLSLAARFCDRLALLADGRVVATGSPEAVLTEAHVERAFDADAAVTRHPVTGAVDVTATTGGAERDSRVHVLGGGRMAARAIATLAEAGFTISAGVLPSGDVATEAATAHGVETVTAEPFAPIDERTRERAAGAVREADVVVLAGVAEGTNRGLAAEAGRVVIVENGLSNAEPRATTGAFDERLRPACVVDVERLPAGVERAIQATADPEQPEAAADD
ncbi:heme ABC transporter ATP-binding protein [Halococcus saccharolyticus]|uniref:Cobalamin import ATP-binding protein BtuD n=1 Tax=Halococcus saccharolyticus DSM 5350 TaxID=1227455 RepID=M0MPC3_9EURY|nr:heme ABC transporter ATP-binding protein [Halococcus saccharolyticus]EMA47547.1 ABC transporter ATP-binding protein [Halococcus saccharolyticus DSM 5350]